MKLYLETLKNKIQHFLRENVDAPLYVEFLSNMSNEIPFEKSGKKWQFVWAKYPDGRRDIGVYSFSEDLVYAYQVWRKMIGIDKDGENIGASLYDRHFKSDLREADIENPEDSEDNFQLDYTDMESEPDSENDAFIQDVVRGGYDVSFSGKFIGNYETIDIALLNLKTEMERSNYFPTIWFISDHGNYWPIDLNGNEIKKDLQERISPNLFKSAINVSKERGTDNRTRKLGSLFFNEFIGRSLLGGKINNIEVYNPQQGNYRDVAITIEYENEDAPFVYGRSKFQSIFYNIDKDLFDIKNEPIDRKDARLLSLIALKINPDSKFKESGKYFNIKGMNEAADSSEDSEQNNNIEGIKYLQYIFNHPKVEYMKFYYGSKSRKILKIEDSGLILDKPIFGLTLKENFVPYNYLMDSWGELWSFTVKIKGDNDEIMLDNFDFTQEEKSQFPHKETPKELAQSDFEELVSDDEKELNENIDIDTDSEKEIESEIESRIRPEDNMLSYQDVTEISEQYNTDFEYVLGMVQAYILKRNQERKNDLKYWVKELIYQFQNENDTNNFLNWDIFYRTWKEEGFQEECFWADEQDVKIEFLKQTSNPNQLSLFETNKQKIISENSERNKEIASTIINQFGGFGKLKAMTGAYNFVAVENGVSFRIKNRSANYIKIILNAKDLYDVEIGRINGTNYKVILNKKDVYAENIKGLIEKETGMYLGLFENKPKDNFQNYYIEYLDASDNFREKKIKFDDFEQAEEWGRKNLPNFNIDMIRFSRNEKFFENISIKNLIENQISNEEESREKLELLKSEGKITLSIGNHGLIFMQIIDGNDLKKSYETYQEAFEHYFYHLANKAAIAQHEMNKMVYKNQIPGYKFDNNQHQKYMKEFTDNTEFIYMENFDLSHKLITEKLNELSKNEGKEYYNWWLEDQKNEFFNQD